VWGRGNVSDSSIFRAVYQLRQAMQAAAGSDVVATLYNAGSQITVPPRIVHPTRSTTFSGITQAARSDAVAALMSARELAACRSGPDMEAAAQAARLALDLDPGYVAAWAAVAEIRVLQAARRLDEAIEMMRRALELNAIGPTVNANLALYQLFAGRLKEAMVTGRELAQRFPTSDNAHANVSAVASVNDLHDEAIALGRSAVALAPHTPLMHAPLAYALARAGRHEEARDILDAIEASALPEPTASTAPVYLSLGDRPTAIAKLTNAYQLGTPQFCWTRDDPRLAELKGEPETEGLWARIHDSNPGNQTHRSLR